MIKSTFVAAILVASTIIVGGCASNREQSTMGQMVDDAKITTQIKARFAESAVVSALAIKVDTKNGDVQLSGFAKSSEEKNAAETIARKVPHVRSVKNDIVIRP